jgi:hypothetical protein
MSSINTGSKQVNLPKPISGRGLTAPGVIILQTLLIGIIEYAEYHISQVGTLTGLAIMIAMLGALYLGRNGTAWVSVVTPPISFAVISLALIVSKNGVHISKFSSNFIDVFGSVAYYLIISSVIGWAWYFAKKRNS